MNDMLKVFFGDMSGAVYNTASYFKYDYEDEWIRSICKGNDSGCR